MTITTEYRVMKTLKGRPLIPADPGASIDTFFKFFTTSLKDSRAAKQLESEMSFRIHSHENNKRNLSSVSSK